MVGNWKTLEEISMSQEREMHLEGRSVINRRALLLIVAVAAIGAIAAGMLAVRRKAPSSSQSRMSNLTSTSHPRGGNLYMQTNETRNAVVHYRWSATGTLTEVERVATGGAGSGELSPIYHINRPNDFEGAGSVILTPDRRFLFTTNA